MLSAPLLESDVYPARLAMGEEKLREELNKLNNNPYIRLLQSNEIDSLVLRMPTMTAQLKQVIIRDNYPSWYISTGRKVLTTINALLATGAVKLNANVPFATKEAVKADLLSKFKRVKSKATLVVCHVSLASAPSPFYVVKLAILTVFVLSRPSLY